MWSNDATTEDLDGLSAGFYTVVATDENGYSVTIGVEITEADAMAISAHILTIQVMAFHVMELVMVLLM